MSGRLTQERGSAFRIKRPVFTASALTADVDPGAAAQLAELDRLLQKRILDPHPIVKEDRHGDHRDAAEAAQEPLAGVVPDNREAAAAEVEKRLESRRRARRKGGNGHDRAAQERMAAQVRRLVDADLTPKHVPREAGASTDWGMNSLADQLACADEGDAWLTLADYIDLTPGLSALKYAFLEAVRTGWYGLEANARAVLDDHPGIVDFLVLRGAIRFKASDPDGLLNFTLRNRQGVRQFAGYAAAGAARVLIDLEKLQVEDYNDDDGELIRALLQDALPLSTTTFKTALRTRIKGFVFDSDEAAIIHGAKLGKLPSGIEPKLIRAMQASPIPITGENAKYFLPHMLLQILQPGGIILAGDPDPTTADARFEVQFQDKANADLEISRPAVQCAAQLFHGMVVGDELDVFGAVEHLIRQRMVQRGIGDLSRSTLLTDLSVYFFDGHFIDLRTQETRKRTHEAERRMFHRQVFARGNAQLADDVVENEEFQQLWKVLILEAFKYLERAQASYNADAFVSRGNVAQAVEDLQYNLSANCTGMATVIAPDIDAELNFVITRILSHERVIELVAPSGGTWKHVVDALNTERLKQKRIPAPIPAATSLYNKAKLGEGILRAIADYVPGAFEDDDTFGAFMGQVDAYITAESKLQRPPRKPAAVMPALPGAELPRSDHETWPGTPEPEPEKADAAPAPAGADEWDF